MRMWSCGWVMGLAGLMAGAAEPTPTPAPPRDELALNLARAILGASDNAARAQLLAAAPAELRDMRRLCAELLPLEYQLSLQGDYVRCEALLQFLLEQVRAQKDEADVPKVQIQLGNVLRELGRSREARELQSEAIAYWERQSNEPALARALVGSAIVDLTLADFQSAQRQLQRAIELAEKRGDTATLIPALNTLGNVYRQQGRPERALQVFGRARAAVGDDAAWNMAFIFNNIGQSYEAMGQLDLAADYVQKALAVAERVKFRPRVANANTFLGEIRLAQGSDVEAAAFFEAALALSRELQNPLSEARALQGLARIELRAGHAEAALARATQAATMYRNLGSRDLLAPALTLQGSCLRALQRNDEARHIFESAIAEVEAVRGQLAGGDVDAQSFLERQVAPYQELVALLVDAGQPAEALVRAEQAKARVLRDLVQRGRPDLASFLTPAEREKSAGSGRRLANANRALAVEQRRQPHSDEAVTAAQVDVRRARGEAEELEDSLRQAHPEAAGREVAGLRPFDPRGLAELTREGMVWVEFVVTAERTFVFSAGKDAVPAVRAIALTRRELTQRVEEFRRQIAQRDLGWRAGARALYDLLLGPLDGGIDRAAGLVLVPDGALWELPFAALLDAGNRPLLERASLRLAPSLESSLRERDDSEGSARSQRAVVNGTPGDVLLVGNPTFESGGEFAPLPETEAQLTAIAAAYAGRTVTRLVGADARVNSCLRLMPGQRVLHFATHGVLNNAEPLASCLVLTQTGLRDGEDGLLEARAILNRSLHARVAVLEACETGRGRTGAGEGLLGLSWAFLAAGCESTVVSQWKIESTSAGAVMIGLHEQLAQGIAPEIALRTAALRVAHTKETSHPFYWAPFVVIGR